MGMTKVELDNFEKFLNCRISFVWTAAQTLHAALGLRGVAQPFLPPPPYHHSQVSRNRSLHRNRDSNVSFLTRDSLTPLSYEWWISGLAARLLGWQSVLQKRPLRQHLVGSEPTTTSAIGVSFWSLESPQPQKFAGVTLDEVKSITLSDVTIAPHDDPKYLTGRWMFLHILEKDLVRGCEDGRKPDTPREAEGTSKQSSKKQKTNHTESLIEQAWQIMAFPVSAITDRREYFIGFEGQRIDAEASPPNEGTPSSEKTVIPGAQYRCTELDFTQAGSLPLMDGIGVDPQYWAPFVEAVGSGSGRIAVCTPVEGTCLSAGRRVGGTKASSTNSTRR